MEREIDKAIDRAGEGLEKGVASIWKKGLVPFFNAVGIGIREVKQKEIWKTKPFMWYMGTVAGASVAAGIIDSTYLADLYPDNFIWHWLYHEQPMRYPLALTVGFAGGSYFFYNKGKNVIKLRQRFILAFERCGLYSSRRVMIDNKNRPEYPTLFKEIVGDDGGITFVFRNVGIPVEEWQKTKPSLEASIGEKISRIEMFNNKPSFIAVKLGGVEIPEKLDFSEELISHCGDSSIVVGVGEQGVLTHDFKKNPHVLVGGATGAGKTVVANSITYQCITKLDGMLYIVDFKGGADYAAFEDMGIDIISEREIVERLLQRLLVENDARVQLFKGKARNIWDYNEWLKKQPGKKKEPLRRIFVLIDELAELTDKKSCPKDEHELVDNIVGLTSRIARLSRFTGINLILATQRPDANVVPGQIKNNVTGRICGYFSDDVAYRIMLDFIPYPRLPDPEVLPGRFMYSIGARKRLVQTPYFQDQHIDPNFKMDYSRGMLTLEGALDEGHPSNQELSPIASHRQSYSIEDIED